MIKRLLQQENAYFDTGALYQNKRFLAKQYYTKPYYFVGGFAVTVWL